MIEIAFSIVNYLDDRRTCQLFEKLAETFGGCKIYVCSNSPVTGPLAGFERHWQSDCNLGYGRGHNSNLVRMLGEGVSPAAVFFLNTDIEFSVANVGRLLQDIESHARKKTFFATITSEGTANMGYFYPYFSITARLPGATPYPAGNFFGVSGPLIQPVLFDPNFFLYFEEVDLRLRYSRVPIFVLYGIAVRHLRDTTAKSDSSPARRFAPISREYIARKNHGLAGWLLARAENIALEIARALV